MPSSPPVFTFITEDGTVQQTYREYMRNEELCRRIRDHARILLNLGLRLVSYPKRWLDSHPREKHDVMLLMEEQRKNPLRFFLPPCARTGFDSPAHQFINDLTHTICGLHAGNRFGKTVLNWVKQLLTRGIIRCDPNWEVFTMHGVRYRGYDGPKQIGFATYNWDNHRTTIYPQIIQAWTPLSALGEYGPGGGKSPNFAASPKVVVDGSDVFLNIYDQPQGAFESKAMHGWAWDEQGTDPKFDGANKRMNTTRAWGYQEDGTEWLMSGWHDFGLTPHKVEGRPDTGAGTFIHRMATGGDTKGMTASFYQGNLVRDTPDWVYPERVKREELEGWIHKPRRTGDHKRLAEGRSRLFGDWHESGSLVYDEWRPDCHWIDPVQIEESWTIYRALDHGFKHNFACLWAAVTPDNDVYVFDLFTSRGRGWYDNVAAVVRRMDNALESIGRRDSGQVAFDTFVERFTTRVIHGTVMDSRSFKAPGRMGRTFTLGDCYRFAGLTTLQPASGLPDKKSLPIVMEWMRPNMDLINPHTGKPGRPRVYVFNTLGPFKKQIERYVWRETPAGNLKAHGEEDILDAFKYLMQIPPRYIPGTQHKKEVVSDQGERGVGRPRSRRTGRVRGIRGKRAPNPITGY